MRATALFSLLSLPLLALPVALAGDRSSNSFLPQESLRLRTPQGVESFRIASLDVAESAAERENPDLADEAGIVPPNTPGYRVTSRIVVRADDAAPLETLRRLRPSVTFEPMEDVPGFWIVDARSVREAIALTDVLSGDFRVREAYLDMESPREMRGLNDPGIAKQWHLHNTQLPIADINVVDAWLAGYTGTGVTVGIVEEGWQTTHTDLAANFNAAASQTGGTTSDHATSCAGLVAAVPNNGKCGVGVACTAKISKLLFGSTSQNAAAFGFKNNLNAIKSNSWGPVDFGRISYLSSVERAAIDTAVAGGRGGKGTIFVWAAGNAAPLRCDYDPYVSNRKVCAIGAIGDQDVRSTYSETGSSLLVVAPSDGNLRGIYTTYTGNQCTSAFGGTSAACPIAAGVIALMLQANPSLGWRDVQHILIHSARKCDPTNAEWTVNGGGHDVNYNYGFGAIDAFAAVQLAVGWTSVPPETSFASGVVAVNKVIPNNSTVGLTRIVEVPANVRVESVELILNIATTNIGDLRIVLTAPSGTESLLAVTRPDPTDNYTNFVFTSRRHWDELAAGTWTIKISDHGLQALPTWTNYQLKIYGTP
jgi:subtilisin family serine protease